MSEVNSEHFSEENPAVSTENITEQPLAAAEKPPVSERKLAANRSNSAKSTGPKTARGKSYSRRNATKHGLLAREIVLASPDGFAGKTEFIQLLAQLREEHAPVGVLENWQVQKIALSFYMQSVVLRAQMGMFQKQSLFAKLRSEEAFRTIDQDAVSRWLEMRSARDSTRRIGSDPGPLTEDEMERIKNLHESNQGTSLVCSFLDELARDCETTGVVTQEQQDLLREHLGHEAEPVLLQLSAPFRNEGERLDNFLLRLNVRSLILGLQARTRKLQNDPQVGDLIPMGEEADLLMRYYAFYSREADHAVAELERLQKIRSAKLVLPPIKKE